MFLTPLSLLKTISITEFTPCISGSFFARNAPCGERIGPKHFRTTAIKNRYKVADQKCKKAVDDFITRKEAELIDQDNLGRFYKYVIE